jgi:parallel beta-helix repeat protein
VSRLVITVVVAAASLLLAAPASAQTVSCGQVITSDTTLANDLADCPGNGLVIGRDGITLDLNGHTVAGRFEGFECQADCLGGHGIDNGRGFDLLTIKNGTVENFDAGVYLQDSSRSGVSDLLLRGSPTPTSTAIGLFLLRSDHNRVQRVRSTRGDPAILLWQSSLNTIADSTADGSVSIHRGTGLVLYAGSNQNRVTHTHINGDWIGLDIVESNGNRIERSDAAGYAGNGLAGNRNVVADSDLHGGRTHGLRVYGTRNSVERNSVTGEGGLLLAGNRNLIEANTVRNAYFGGIVVRSGDRNSLSGNSVFNSQAPSYGIHVQPDPTRTLLVDNLVANSAYDGIRIDAPGTVVARNTANDNGNLGINAVPGTVDAGGNRASGNGNPLQCVNVFCQAPTP